MGADNSPGLEQTTPAPERPRILAVLNCYSPEGANRGQVVVRADGSTEVHGDLSLLKAPLAAVRSIDLRSLRWVPATRE